MLADLNRSICEDHEPVEPEKKREARSAFSCEFEESLERLLTEATIVSFTINDEDELEGTEEGNRIHETSMRVVEDIKLLIKLVNRAKRYDLRDLVEGAERTASMVEDLLGKVGRGRDADYVLAALKAADENVRLAIKELEELEDG